MPGRLEEVLSSGCEQLIFWFIIRGSITNDCRVGVGDGYMWKDVLFLAAAGHQRRVATVTLRRGDFAARLAAWVSRSCFGMTKQSAQKKGILKGRAKLCLSKN